MARRDQYLVGLDVGTSKVVVVVGDASDPAGIDLVGYGVAESRGVRRGEIVNLEEAIQAIRKAVAEAEQMAGIDIDTVYLGISGTRLKGFNSRGVVAVTGRNREVTREDVGRAIDAAKGFTLPAGQELLHVLPQDFVVDEHDGIQSPVGMTGSRLEVNVHIITSNQTATHNLVACANRAGMQVAETVVDQLASADAVLSEDEKELGVALVDIGAGTVNLAIFDRGTLWHTAVKPIGGDHFTNDIHVALRTPLPDAEKLKRRAGCALASMILDDEMIEVPSVGGRPPRTFARRSVAEFLQPRGEELFHLVWDEICSAGYERHLNAGLVLTGGGANLYGMADLAEHIFKMPVRVGVPEHVGRLSDHLATAEFATGVGLVLHGYHRLKADGQQPRHRPGVAGVWDRCTDAFRKWM